MRKQVFSIALCALLMSLGVSSGGVSAQGTPATPASGFSINRFDSAEMGSDWFSGDSLDLRGHLRPGVGLTLDWANQPLVRYPQGADPIAVVENQAFAHLAASLVLVDRLRLAVDIPMLVHQSGTAVNVRDENGVTSSYGGHSGFAMGDIRAAVDVRLVGEYGDAFTLAAGAQLHLPTGSREAFAGDGSIRLVPRLMVAGDLSILAYSVRAAVAYRAKKDDVGDLKSGSEMSFVATAGLRLADKKVLIGPELWGTTGFGSERLFKKASTPFELIFGVHYFPGPFRLGLGVGPGLSRGIGAPAYRVLASFAVVEKAIVDRDEDTILDNVDACPDTPGVAHDDPKRHGCPSDRDDDDIYDVDDACPDLAGVPNKDPRKHGCPRDRDDDGIYDTDDACPRTPGIATDDPETNGCPPDRDGDGIYDDDDACPDEPGVATDDPKTNGCPADRDGDGIYDKDDACPDVPGVESSDPAMHGCPIAVIEEDEIKIFQRIEFETDSAKLLYSSENVLNAVLEILETHGEIGMVLVEGHTDNVGKPAYNRKLSQKRAASVVQWLVEHDIARERLRFEGMGLTRPIADNDSDASRQKNRRVEFHIEVVDGKQVETGDEEDEEDEDNSADEDSDDDFGF